MFFYSINLNVNQIIIYMLLKQFYSLLSLVFFCITYNFVTCFLTFNLYDMKFLDEFKAFAMRGNVIDMAVGVIIGGAFGKIVSSLVADIIMPPVGYLVGGVKFTDLSVELKAAVPATADSVAKDAVTLNYGNFLQATFDFLIIAFSIFLFIKLINNFAKKKEEPEVPAPPPEPTKEEVLLSEIRDLLKEKK